MPIKVYPREVVCGECMYPRIAFVTTCKGRSQHLVETLPKNLASNADYENAVFVVVDYGGCDNLKERLYTLLPEAIDSGRLVVYTYQYSGKFQIAKAKNMAHRCGIMEGADVLVNLDADNFTGNRFADYVSALIDCPDSRQFLFTHMIKGVMPRGVNGRIVVTARQFVNVGGYDERFEQWCHDDKDLDFRLRRAGYKNIAIDPSFLNCIRHNDKMRFKEYPEAMGNDYDGQLMIDQSARDSIIVVNFGNIGCGTVYRNLDPTPIEIAPLPTRIFGIGMHKTGTTSLHAAFEILGYDSAHWISAPWAKNIWREVRAFGRSPLLEHHYALCDLPIPALYDKLDKAYPGSKFILTTRPDGKWLNSVQKHFDEHFNPVREGWGRDVFSHRIHNEIYGRTDFDAETFLAAYKKHNAAVLEYFKDRPNDLLVMNMDKNAGWESLCTFLGKPVPSEPYPVRNIGKS